MTQELELYKLLTEVDEDEWNIVQELGWISDKEFCVWVSYVWIDDFVTELKRIFGLGMFDVGGFDARMQCDCICIDLCVALEGYIDIEEVFTKEKYQH